MFTAKDVQTLREKTGVGMMDCKKALTEANGNMDRAVEILREKGMATAAKKAGRVACQGIVDSYIHMGGKIGVLVEVNCETDFVAKSEQFLSFVHDVALQIAAAKPTYISKDEVPQSEVQAEKEIFKAQALNEEKPKPMNIIEKMVEGRISKFYKEVALLEQDFVKDGSKTIATLLNEITAKIGEKISIRRFVRYEMGEGLEKKEDNFADEINAQVAKMMENK
jgi:elongation factor Ts